MNDYMIIGIGFGKCDCPDTPEWGRPLCKQHVYMVADDGVVLTNRMGELDETDTVPFCPEFHLWAEPAPLSEIMDEFNVLTP